MVEYFGELIDGFASPRTAWVQSYGSRCVKPPVIYGDIARRGPMTSTGGGLAQSLTVVSMKGMLTGPVTILQWSFVKDDQPRRKLPAVGLGDSRGDSGPGSRRLPGHSKRRAGPREGLPLLKADAAEYLQWAVDSFRLASAGVQEFYPDSYHMCYAEFTTSWTQSPPWTPM